ncbi:MAG: formate dehydrogenase subunit alpha [Actinobacteria bacterium]|nr:formate dehydrogenase subunit alpha [Actinomycetota bacterium]
MYESNNEGKIKIYVNNKPLNVDPEKSILESCLDNGIFIPNLCYDPRLKPQGACRLCLVEVEGMDDPAASCVTKPVEGMRILTDTPRIKELVRVNLELIISDHPMDCMTCDMCGNCMLQDLAYLYDIKESTYTGKVHEKKVLQDNPFIYRDNEKCILCGRCVRMCDNVVGANAIGYSGRGFECEIIPAYEQSLKDTECVFCGNCISACPVGALQSKPYMKKTRIWEVEKTRTVCPYCGTGCILELHVRDNRIVNVDSPIDAVPNKGILCVKGRTGHDFVASPDRLTHPLMKTKSGKFKKISWEKAIKEVSGNLQEISRKYGPDSIAVWSSARCTNEENFLMSKFARAVIGTNNVDHCARVCHAPSISGLVPTFGSGAMTNSIDDMKYAEVAIIIGSNTTESHPVVGYELIRCVNEHGLKLIVIDPRDIFITRYATIHLKQKPGTDIAVLLGIMNIIFNSGLHDDKFISSRTTGFEELKECFREFTADKAAKISGVDMDDLIKAAKLYGSAKNGMIVYGIGITEHTCGTENVMAVADLAMMTGNVGRKGTGVNPLRGQNNVQGACDMGALPDVLSGYQGVSNDSMRWKFEKSWGKILPSKTGLTATDVLEEAHSGKIKALYIMGENHMISDADLTFVSEALKKLDFLAVQDIFLTETAELADIVLPGVCFAEKEGTFTNTERRVQRVRKAVEPPGLAMDDWKIISMLSNAMGYKMDYSGPSEIMDEIAGLTPIYGGISYDRIEKTGLQWPCRHYSDEGTKVLHTRTFTRGDGRFIPVHQTPPAENPDSEFPLLLTTGRILYQFNTGTMTRKNSWINEIAPENYVQINTEDAKKIGIRAEDKVIVESRRGKITATALVNSKIKKGVVFMPFHYSDSPTNYITNSAYDTIAKTPEYKACAVRITPSRI